MENFNNYERVLDKYQKSLYEIRDFLTHDKNVTGYTLFGEILGGFYRGMNSVPGAVKVQKEVDYTPDNDFYAFDLKLFFQDGSELIYPYESFDFLMFKVGIPYAKALFIGSFEEALKYPNEFDSTIPELYGYPKLENNVCEGVVIKPVEPKFYGPSRIILKNKNAKFSEKHGEKKEVVVKDVTPEQKELLENYLAYNTENRLKNVISKIGTITNKDFGMLLGHTTQDILIEAGKDGIVQGEMSNENYKRVKKLLSSEIALLIRNNFLNILDNNF